MIHAEPSEQIDPFDESYVIDVNDLGGSDPDVVELDDGSAILYDDVGAAEQQAFDGNLVDIIDKKFLDTLASDYIELITEDKDSRDKRDKQYEEGLRRTGLSDDAPGGAKFEGASKVVHPVLIESCIDFASRAIKELFPAEGPIKIKSQTLLNPESEKKAKALAACMNRQFTTDIPEYRSEFEKELTQLPLGGSQFMKLYWDSTKNRICAEFIPIDDIFIPYSATNFYDSPRVTHRQYVNKYDFKKRVESGRYASSVEVLDSDNPELSASKIANDSIEGKTPSSTNEDGLRTIYEVYTYEEFDEDDFSKGERSPYIITIDDVSNSILSIRRNWDENDPVRNKLDWITEDVFIHWLGAYGIGLFHIIGGLSIAATGALRALLDSAHANNAPTLLKTKNSKLTGQNKSVDITKIVEVEGPVNADDIRKFLMPMPFNPPSPVLFQLLGWLTDAAKQVVTTASDKIADATSNTPVGTTQALIEQGAVIFSSIHARLHHSQVMKFKIVLRLLKTYGADRLVEYGIDPNDATLDLVQPVSDPRIFSEAQRFAVMQGVMQLANSDPEVKYNKLELHRSMLQLMKVDNVDRFLPMPQQPQPTDPAQEMVSFVKNMPVVTDIAQDHVSHIVAHIGYLKNPLYGTNPIMVPITMKVLDHLKEHLLLYFASRLAANQHPDDIVVEDMQVFAEIGDVINDATVFVKNNMDWMNPDPTIMSTRMLTEAQRVETERRSKEDQLKHERELAKIRSEIERNHRESLSRIAENESQSKAALDRIKQLREEALLDAKIDLWKNREDNATKIQIEAAKLAQQKLDETVPTQPAPDIAEPLKIAMEALNETIRSVRAPRKITAIFDDSNEIIGSRSEIDTGE